MLIIIDNNTYDVHEAIHRKLNDYKAAMEVNYAAAMAMQSELNQLKDSVRELRLKKQTAKAHPTKDMRFAAWECEIGLYRLVGIEVKQLELM